MRANNLTIEVQLKQDWKDLPNWSGLYQTYSLRRPAFNLPCTPRLMKRYLHKLGVTVPMHKEYTGLTLAQYIAMNPRVPLYAWLGTILEALADGSIKPLEMDTAQHE